MKEFDKLIEAYGEVTGRGRKTWWKGTLEPNPEPTPVNPIKKTSPNLYTDVLYPLHSILAVDEHVGETLENVDELLHFLLKKNPSIQNDLLEYVKSKSV